MTEDRGQRTDNRKLRTVNLVLVCVIVFIAFSLRVFRLDFFSLRGDEAFTVIFVQRTWEGLWKGIGTVEPNPPLMYLALRAWVALAGASEFATRYFSAFFGVLCVPLLYRLAREMFSQFVIASREAAKQSPPKSKSASLPWVARNDTIALIAAALIAINPYQIWHSQDVRNYTMWPALSLLALIFLWRWWKLETADYRRQTTDLRFTFYRSYLTSLSFYIFATLACLYTHYYDVFILAAVNVFVFALAILGRRWKTLARWIGAQVVLVLLYAPWVLFGTNRITTYGEASAEQSVSLVDQFSRTLSTFVLGDTVPADLKAMLWLPLAIVLIAILIYLAARNRALAAFLFLYISIPSLALYVISIGRPLFLERYLNGIAPGYYLLLAIGIAALWQWRSKWRVAAAAIAILFFVGTSAYAMTNYEFNPDYAKAPNWRALGQYIALRQQPGDVIIQNFTEMSPLYYRSGNINVLTVPRDFWARPEDEKTLQQLNKDYSRIWFIPAQPDAWDTDQFVEKFLSRNDDRIIDTRVSEFRLQLYVTPRDSAAKIVPVNARVGNATLVGYRAEGMPALHVVLYWRANQKIAKDYTVFVHVADSNGQVVAQQDRTPAFGTYPTTAWQPGELIVDAYDLTVNEPPGKYALTVGMYDAATLVRVPVFDSNGTRLNDDQVVLTQITSAP
jgi:mannosyltransferase